MLETSKGKPPYWDTACAALGGADPIMARLIAKHSADHLRGSGDPFCTLANAIVGQQISVFAAESIWKRLTAAFPRFVPGELAAANLDTLRSLGLSLRKAEYLQGLAHAFLEGRLQEEELARMEDQEVHKKLCALRGIGPWTTEMFLIFHLQRPDILPLGDLGLVNAAAKLYRWEAQTSPEKKEALRQHAETWRPWRTVATWFIWRELDAEPVIY